MRYFKHKLQDVLCMLKTAFSCIPLPPPPHPPNFMNYSVIGLIKVQFEN